MRQLVMVAAGTFLSLNAASAADPAFYVRKAGWQDSMMASRGALVEFDAAQKARERKASAPRDVEFGAWHVTGPFVSKSGKGIAEPFPPERAIDFSKTYEDGRLKWAARPDWEDDERHELPRGRNEAFYLARTITANKSKRITATFGGDDQVAAWLNGRPLFGQEGRPSGHGRVTMQLPPGENKFLLKVFNTGGLCSFDFASEERRRRRDPVPQWIADLWVMLQRDFADAASLQQMRWERTDNIWQRNWTPGDTATLAKRYAGATRTPPYAAEARKAAGERNAAPDLAAVRALYYRSRRAQDAMEAVKGFQFEPLRTAIADLSATFGAKYPKGGEFLARLDALKKEAATLAGDNVDVGRAIKLAGDCEHLRREALLANPLLDFEKLLLVKRRADAPRLGLPQNWQGNSSLPRSGYDDEIVTLPLRDADAKPATLFRPQGSRFVGDIELHWDAARMLFSSTDSNNTWQVFEVGADGGGLRQVTVSDKPDVDNFDGCYLPNGDIVYCSTACMQGVPCVGGGDHVALLYRCRPDGSGIRQLTFDQDHNWCPTMLNNGRVIYTRWEYSDTPHYFTRIVFHMNPDGTDQRELYGSNSYWPNTTLYARPIPGEASQFIGIVSGHHGVPRMGEIIIFDPAKGQREASGVVQRIPGRGQTVEPKIVDALVQQSWPKFLHPHPLSAKYFLVSCQPDANAPWGVYLVDVFDNILPLRVLDGYALFEPTPLHARPMPPVVPDKVNPDRKDAVIAMSDIYAGPGLAGVPRGSVKKLRVFANNFAYCGMGGHISIGIDGSWDVKVVLGTVPVQEDGSAMFRAPANTPLIIQPLDADGKAMQVMRSWMTAMPGETLSCVGCHESQHSAVPVRRTLAATQPVAEIEPWRGPARGFSFEREVQPVLDKCCVGCHNGQSRPDGAQLPDFRGARAVGNYKGRFTPSYEALHRYVRRPGNESDYHLQVPLEFHADTSELVQMLQKGHHGVKLDAEAWDRLITWIDLNVPCLGTWHEYRTPTKGVDARRQELRERYAGVVFEPESGVQTNVVAVTPVMPQPVANPKSEISTPDGWPFDATEAKRRQAAAGLPVELKVPLADKIEMQLVLAPAGEFVMGDANGAADERPLCVVRIEKPFYIGSCEVSNGQFAQFDPAHDSAYISVHNKDLSIRGEPANRPQQPVIRVSWQRAMEFCRWLSEKTGRRFALPTEAQWEYACRAGADTTMNYGPVAADFARLANFADERFMSLIRRDSPRWLPIVGGVTDGAVVSENIGKYAPNAWGLRDMHGNVAEWTLSNYKPYPYARDGRDVASPEGRKVARGGSFYDRPQRGTSSFRLSYPSWQRVFNVGFRVVCEAGPATPAVASR